MLEVLFAHQNQEEAFLAFLCCGLALGLMLHTGTALRGRRPLLCALWDVLTAALMCGMVFLVLLRFRTGLRAYALLGVLLGVLLYLAGLAQLLEALAGFFQKDKNSARPKAGK